MVAGAAGEIAVVDEDDGDEPRPCGGAVRKDVVRQVVGSVEKLLRTVGD